MGANESGQSSVINDDAMHETTQASEATSSQDKKDVVEGSISYGLNYVAYTRGFEPPKKPSLTKRLRRRIRRLFTL